MSNDEINRVIQDHMDYIIERFYNKATRKWKKNYRIEEPTKIIEQAKELSETGIPTLESVKAVIKKIEDDYEEFDRKLREKKGGSKKWLIVFTIWAILTFFIALAINLAFWGALTSQYGKGYWETLFSDGLWAFLVSGIGAIVIIVLVSQGDFP